MLHYAHQQGALADLGDLPVVALFGAHSKLSVSWYEMLVFVVAFVPRCAAFLSEIVRRPACSL